MKAAFDRELQNLELQARSQKIDSGHRHDNGNYDYSSSGASVGAELFASSCAESRILRLAGSTPPSSRLGRLEVSMKRALLLFHVKRSMRPSVVAEKGNSR